MPRSTKEILAQAEEFAKRFEDYEPTTATTALMPDRFATSAMLSCGAPRPTARSATLSPSLEPRGTRGRRSARCLARQVRRRGSATAT